MVCTKRMKSNKYLCERKCMARTIPGWYDGLHLEQQQQQQQQRAQWTPTDC
jgi:hypothetical protein